MVETAARHERLVRDDDLPRWPRPRLRLCPLQEHRLAFAAVVAEVEVDETGSSQPRLVRRRRRPGHHSGRRAQPDRGRHHPGARAWTLKEGVRFADGRVASDSWDDYPILRFSEVPEIDIRLIDNPNEPTLGLGEASVGPTAAAIGNAVARALGRRIRDLPLTRERIMATLLAEN